MRPAFRRILPLLAIVSAAAGTATAAGAAMHLRLVKSEPAKDSVVDAPRQLRLWFSLKPALAVTSVKLVSASGTPVKLGAPKHAGDAKLPVEVTVEETLAPGTYTLSWKTASSDMHPVTGDFSFTVK
jgi:hypothetical protein